MFKAALKATGLLLGIAAFGAAFGAGMETYPLVTSIVTLSLLGAGAWYGFYLMFKR